MIRRLPDTSVLLLQTRNDDLQSFGLVLNLRHAAQVRQRPKDVTLHLVSLPSRRNVAYLLTDGVREEGWPLIVWLKSEWGSHELHVLKAGLADDKGCTWEEV
jgi:hypothetical protein